MNEEVNNLHRDLDRTVKECTKLLKAHHHTLAIAESCTGGLVSHSFTNIPGSSQILLSGLVVYSNQAKILFTKVDPALITLKGAVSAEVAHALAIGVKDQIDADYGIGITGIAGPEGGSIEKPIGLVFISVVSESNHITQKYYFTRNRIENKYHFAISAVYLLKKLLLSK